MNQSRVDHFMHDGMYDVILDQINPVVEEDNESSIESSPASSQETQISMQEREPNVNHYVSDENDVRLDQINPVVEEDNESSIESSPASSQEKKISMQERESSMYDYGDNEFLDGARLNQINPEVVEEENESSIESSPASSQETQISMQERESSMYDYGDNEFLDGARLNQINPEAVKEENVSSVESSPASSQQMAQITLHATTDFFASSPESSPTTRAVNSSQSVNDNQPSVAVQPKIEIKCEPDDSQFSNYSISDTNRAEDCWIKRELIHELNCSQEGNGSIKTEAEELCTEKSEPRTSETIYVRDIKIEPIDNYSEGSEESPSIPMEQAIDSEPEPMDQSSPVVHAVQEPVVLRRSNRVRRAPKRMNL